MDSEGSGAGRRSEKGRNEGRRNEDQRNEDRRTGRKGNHPYANLLAPAGKAIRKRAPEERVQVPTVYPLERFDVKTIWSLW